MNSYEKEEISKLPYKYRPMGAWGYFGYSILYTIPLIGFICLIVFAISDANISRRSHARSYFCGLILAIIVIIIVAVLVVALGAGSGLLDSLKSIIPQN